MCTTNHIYGSPDITDQQINKAIEKAKKEEFEGSEVKNVAVKVKGLSVCIWLWNDYKSRHLYYILQDGKLDLVDRTKCGEAPLALAEDKQEDVDAQPILALFEDRTTIDNDHSPSEKKYIIFGNESAIANFLSEEEHTIINPNIKD